MLEPQSRTLLLDALRPPDEYMLDYAVGTTYSLDLVAMLAAPLAFALLDRTNREGRLVADIVSLLEAVRHSAEKMAVFCNVGGIKVPCGTPSLNAYLEASVCEVSAPHPGGVFHPKVWVLRFVKEGAPIRYRLLCSSRNLTFDRSWDTLLVLEGDLKARANAFGRNHPLADFVKALPGLAVRSVPAAIQQRVAQFETELRKVDFELPSEFSELAFWPLGIPGHHELPFQGRIDRLLAVAPFVCERGLDALADSTKELHLVSRLEQLQLFLANDLHRCESVQCFAEEEPSEEEGDDPDDEEGDTLDGRTAGRLSGLHAKIFVADLGWNASVWTGSANATAAAFERNVEFLVQMNGKKSACGIDAFLGNGSNQTGLAAFLLPFQAKSWRDEEPLIQQDLELALDREVKAIACAELRLVVQLVEAGEGWDVSLRTGGNRPLKLSDRVALRVWPTTCKEESTARPISGPSADGELARFPGVTTEALTSFIACRLELERGGRFGHRDFVMNLPVEGLPEDRQQRLLMRLLGNSEAVMRYLLLLLQDPLERGAELPTLDTIGVGSMARRAGIGLGESVLEPLVRALHRHPARLDEIAKLLADLNVEEAGKDRVPAEWGAIWGPIWQVRKALCDEDAKA